jgi:hypothetical protein
MLRGSFEDQGPEQAAAQQIERELQALGKSSPCDAPVHHVVTSEESASYSMLCQQGYDNDSSVLASLNHSASDFLAVKSCQLLCFAVTVRQALESLCSFEDL